MVDLEESFEYERKFLVTNPGVVDGVIPEFILQGYLTVAEHYAVRVRLVADGSDQSLDVFRREKECRGLLGKGLFPFDSAILAVKSPSSSRDARWPLSASSTDALLDRQTSTRKSALPNCRGRH